MATSQLDHLLMELNEAVLRQDEPAVRDLLTREDGPTLSEKHLRGYQIGHNTSGGSGLTSPLSVAAQAGLAPMLALLLEGEVATGVCDLALEACLLSARWDSLHTIWPRASGACRAEVFLATLQRSTSPFPDRWHALLDGLAFEISADTFKGKEAEVNPLLQTALAQLAGLGHVPLLRALIPLTDPADRQSLALRAAVEQGHDEAIRLLLPHSDIQSARYAWLRRKQPLWDAVDRLSLYLTPEQQKTWGRDLTHMPRLTSVQRCETTEASPPERPTRRRLRS